MAIGSVGWARRFLVGLALVLLAVGCAPLPHRARVRQEAGYLLLGCLHGAERPYRSEVARLECLAEARRYCQARGLEPTCGLGEAWTAERY